MSLLLCWQWRLRTCSGEDTTVRLQKGVWPRCRGGPGGLESRSVSHVGLPVARQEQLEGKESLFPSRCGAECGSAFVGLGLDLGSVVSAITRKLEL